MGLILLSWCHIHRSISLLWLVENDTVGSFFLANETRFFFIFSKKKNETRFSTWFYPMTAWQLAGLHLTWLMVSKFLDPTNRRDITIYKKKSKIVIDYMSDTCHIRIWSLTFIIFNLNSVLEPTNVLNTVLVPILYIGTKYFGIGLF